MNGPSLIERTIPALLEFRGPDAVRFLNGQLTQDVRRVAGGAVALPSCVTDAKGRLQFRITVMEPAPGVLWVAGPDGSAEALEARLTRYLIADDVEVSDLSGKWLLCHFIGPMPAPPPGVIARSSNRHGVDGTDWWLPADRDVDLPSHEEMSDDEREALRIAHGVPAWGSELSEGMLPPEAGLEGTDISYDKGCYIGQEVISRIKSAGKVNRRLHRFAVDARVPLAPGPLENGAGEITSVSPIASGEIRHALGFVRRGASELFYKSSDGTVHPVRTC